MKKAQISEICAYCGKPIGDDGHINIVMEDGRQFHNDCYELFRLDEVTDAYNKDGNRGLDKISQEDALDDLLGLS